MSAFQGNFEDLVSFLQMPIWCQALQAAIAVDGFPEIFDSFPVAHPCSRICWATYPRYTSMGTPGRARKASASIWSAH